MNQTKNNLESFSLSFEDLLIYVEEKSRCFKKIPPKYPIFD